MRNLRPLTLFVLLAACLRPAPAWSAEPAEADPCLTDLTEEKLNNPPGRKTKIERVEEPHVLELQDIKLVDQKYVASIRIILPNSAGSPFGKENPEKRFGRMSRFLAPTDLQNRPLALLQIVYRRPLLGTGGGSPFPRDPGIVNEPYEACWKRMLDQIPVDRQPAKELQGFFTSPTVTQYLYNANSWSAGSSSGGPDFRLLAATPQQAEERAKVLLTILDQGFSRPLQLGLFKLRTAACQELPASEAQLAAAWKELQAIDAQLKEYAEFVPDTLTGLRVQQFQLDVELAGLRTKIETCDRLIKAGGTAERRKQIEEAKLAAEIELAGCESRHAKSAEIIAKVTTRKELVAKRDSAANKSNSLRNNRNGLADRIRVIDEEIEAFGPVRLVDDRITIHPVEWTK